MSTETTMSKPLDGAGLAVVNQIFNERLSRLDGGITMTDVNTAIQTAIGSIEEALSEV